MKKKTNCPNCGGPLPIEGIKCEFCGTRVIDLTMIDFDSHEPTMFVLHMPKSITGSTGQPLLLSMWAKPELEAIRMENNATTVYGGLSDTAQYTISNPEVAFEMTLRPCPDHSDSSLFKIATIDN